MEAQQIASLSAPNATIEGRKQITTFPSRNESAAQTKQYESIASPNATREETIQEASLAAPNATIECNMQIKMLAENASAFNYSISLYQNVTLGEFLVDPKGTALYYFTRDEPGKGTSNCADACLKLWQPFYTSALTIEPGLNQSDFSIFTRADGRMQIAFMGWPLYSYAKDASPGEAKGQGFNGVWFIIDPGSFSSR
jgi:predicted lipoprotein with Yx(FWY)xxD motif